MPKSVWESLAPPTRKNVTVRMLSGARDKTLAEILDALPEKTITMIHEQLQGIAERKKADRIKALKEEILNKEKELKSLQK